VALPDVHWSAGLFGYFPTYRYDILLPQHGSKLLRSQGPASPSTTAWALHFRAAGSIPAAGR